MSGRLVLAGFRWCLTKLSVIALSNHVPYEVSRAGLWSSTLAAMALDGPTGLTRNCWSGVSWPQKT